MIHKDLGEKIFAASQYNKEREYWLDKLSGELVKTGFPPDNVPGTSGIQAREIKSLDFPFPPDLCHRLMEIINNSDSRLHIALVTGLFLFLYKYTGNLDILIGTPIDKQDMEGEFINTILPLRHRIDEESKVKELLKQVKQTVIEASENQNYPIETIPHELGLPASANNGDFPLFNTALLLQNIQDQRYIEHINLDILFSFLRTEDSLQGTIQYNAALFEEKTIQRFANHFLHLMQEAFFHVDLKLLDVPLQTEADKNAMIFDFNNTLTPYPSHKMIHQLFEEQVSRTPGNIAVQTATQQLTYQQLNQQANQLARILREKGIGNDSVAAIMLESSLQIPVAILSVLKAGGAYLPMGFEYPEERIDYLLKNSQAKILITRTSLLEGKHIDCPVLCLDDDTLYTGNDQNLEPVNNPGSLVYIIYTSGTTGFPKGVMIEQRGLVNYISWAARTYVKDEKLDFPLYTSISFDLTVTSIFTPLITGNSIIVYGGVDKKLYIEDVIDDNRVGIVKLTPSHLKLIRSKIIKNSRIKRLIVGGEELEVSLARDIYNNFDGKIEIYNEYGPTETVVGSMVYKFDPAHDTRHSVPIGIPIANTQVYLLNKHFQPLPVGMEGELYIAGDGLARGYLFNPQMTQEKFLPNPFIAGKNMYKTGDIATRLDNGYIEYKGRIDHQVKIRGHRVETGEIEAKIVTFQKMLHAGREQKENIVDKLDLKSLQHCKTCLIPANYPGGIKFDQQGVCEICKEFETYKDQAFAYFKNHEDFVKVVQRAQEKKRGKYDCLLLYSGGKDSSFVLHSLVEMGLKVLAFTFDNGYISDKAFENIKRTTEVLKVDQLTLDSAAMKEIFVESLWSDYNVCNGCFKAVNTLGTKIAQDNQINLVISGLTRGQIFDIKLHGLFQLGVFDDETIEERLTLFRKNYHSMSNRTSRLIGVEIADETLDNTYFIDFFRYHNTPTHEIFEYLSQKDKGWIRPTDTGASSSNCIINDVGIYVHLKDKGCHFYAPQLSWDCRLGTITREEGLEEMWGYKANYARTQQVLNEIGYYNAFTGAVVTDVKDDRGEKVLCAYILADKELEVSELRGYLSQELPDYMIPTFFTKIDRIPLTPSGKIDRKALPEPKLELEGEYVSPRNPIEERLAAVWADLLGFNKENIGIDVNFFEVGGHSLRATFLAAAIHKEFNVKVPLVKIFEVPTIRGLAAFIEESTQEAFATIESAGIRDYYVLSSAQTRFYILQQMDLNSTAYHSGLTVELEGNLDIEKLEKTFSRLLERHENLRTSFTMKEKSIVQIIHPFASIEFKMSYYPLDSPHEAKAVKTILNEFVRPFDLSTSPLIRAGLIRLTPVRHILVVDLHHILSDGISLNILIQDFKTYFNGHELPPLKLQYKDYAEWQQSKAVKGIFQQQEKYWLGKFAGEIPVLNLPYDYPRPEIQSFMGNALSFSLTPEETQALNELAHSQGTTLFMVLLAIYNIFLAKMSNQEDIIVGTPIAGRRHADLQQIIGIFVNTLALRNAPEAKYTFQELLAQIKDSTLKAFDNQDYQFEDLVSQVVTQRDMSRNPLFDAMLILQNMFNPSGSIAETQMEGLTIKPHAGEMTTSQVDLTLNASELHDRLLFSFGYCTLLFKEESIEKFTRYFRQVITSVLENPGKTISAIDIIPVEERHRLLTVFNNTTQEYPPHHTIKQLFEHQAEIIPNHDAVTGVLLQDGTGIDGQPTLKTLTYREFNERSNQLARLLQNKGVQPDTLVVVMVERSLEMMIGIWAVLKAGGAYIPIDPLYPEDRIRTIMEDSRATLLLTSKKLAPITAPFFAGIELDDPSIYHPDATNLKEDNEVGDLAYVIYTSGSTGTPKGVMIEHRGFNNLASSIREIIPFTKEDTILSLTTISFDIFAVEGIVPLTAGAKVVVATENVQMDVTATLQSIIQEGVTILQVTPSRLTLLLSLPEYSDGLKSVNHLLVGGEVFPADLLEKARNVITGKIYNGYGPTETTIYSTIKDVSRGEILNIGRPIANNRIYILGPSGNLQPIGVPGELCVAGSGLARGYLHNEDLTREYFIANPYETGQRLYRTGDIALWLPDGNLQFLGRKDFQVKIRGFRIELGEIESQLNKHPRIKKAVAVCKPMIGGDKHIIAYFVAKEPTQNSPDSASLNQYLSHLLPDYMIPSYFIPLEQIPLTPNGKIDRKLLPAPEIFSNQDYAAPRNELEEKLTGLWAEELGVEKESIGVDTNFFYLGGQSLKAIIILAKIHKELNVKLQLTDLFKAPSIRGLAQYIEKAAKDVFQAITPAEKKKHYPLSPAQKRLYILQQFDPTITNYNMPQVINIPGKIDKEKLEFVFQTLINRHESLRTSFETVNEEPVQRIHEQVAFFIQEHHLYLEAAKKLVSNFTLPFDLSQAPLLRVDLLTIDDSLQILLIDMHHIITDETSQGILTREFMALYEGKELPPIKLQYKDYAQWQYLQTMQNKFAPQEKYWLHQFEEEAPVLNLPTDYSRPPIQSFEGATIEFPCTPQQVQWFNQISKSEGVTSFMVMLAVYNIFLSKISNQEDIVVGFPIAGRNHSDLENIIGMFVNTLAIRNYPSGDIGFNDFLKDVKKRALTTFENQDYQFEELVDKISVDRDMSRNPLFDVMLVLQNAVPQSIEKSGIENKNTTNNPSFTYKNRISKFDLTLTLTQLQGQSMNFEFTYCTKLFQERTILRFGDYLKAILTSVSENPNTTLAAIEIISKEEKHRILYDLNATQHMYPKDKTIHHIFQEQATKTPDNTALCGSSITVNHDFPIALTYQKIDHMAGQLAQRLVQKGVQPDAIVAIMVEPSLEMVIGLLAILKAGGAYLPIDPAYPRERIDFMLKDSSTNLLMTSQTVEKKQKSQQDETRKNLELVFLDASESYSTLPSFLPPPLHASPTNLAYIIYTSGTTGKPKGVLIQHKNVVRLLFNDQFQFNFKQSEVWTLFHSFAFDFSVWEMYGALLRGSRLIVLPRSTAQDPNQFLKILSNHSVTVLNQTPSAFYSLISEVLGSDNYKLYLKYVIFGGEALHPGRLKEWRKKYPLTQLVNMFGITETCVHVTYKEISESEIAADISNIGKPIPTLSTYILDRYQKLSPIGIAGEVYVGGEGVARGYLNLPELTAEKFLKNPYKIEERLYRSGDLARVLENGEMVYLGRIDQQVQVRGFRVELGEIENRLRGYDGIKDAVVIAGYTPDQQMYLCAYIVPEVFTSEKTVDIAAIRKHLSLFMPDYMIPNYFVSLEKIKLTPNGKLDRKALPEPYLNLDTQYTPPTTDLQKKLVKIWLQVLAKNLPLAAVSTESIGIDNNFFQLGGHSLKATILTGKIHKELNVKIPLSAIFTNPTIRGLAEFIGKSKKDRYDTITPVEEKEYYPISSAQKGLYIFQQMQPESKSYNMPTLLTLAEEMDHHRMQHTFQQLIDRHESLRTSFVLMAGEAVQIVHREVRFAMEYHESDIENAQKIVAGFLTPFTLSHAPLMKAGLIKVGPNHHILMVDMHHIISDGLSMTLFVQEFMTIYAGMPLPPLKLQYKDYSHWLSQDEQKLKLREQEDFWLRQFAGEIPVLNLQTDYPRPSQQSFEGDRFYFEIGVTETDMLKKYAAQAEATLYMVLLALFNVLFSKLSGQEDIILGTVTSGRRHEDLQKIIGMFVSTLALRNYPTARKTFMEFIEEVRDRTLQAFENQEYLLDELVEKILPKRDRSRNPLFDVMFSFGNIQETTLTPQNESTGVKLVPYQHQIQATKFDISMIGSESNGALLFTVEYATKLFNESTIKRIAGYFKEIMAAVIQDKDMPLGEIAVSFDLLKAKSARSSKDIDGFTF